MKRCDLMEREELAITEMYKNIESSVKSDREQLTEFELKARIHLGSVLSSLVFVVMIGKVTKDVTKSSVKKHCKGYKKKWWKMPMIWCYYFVIAGRRKKVEAPWKIV